MTAVAGLDRVRLLSLVERSDPIKVESLPQSGASMRKKERRSEWRFAASRRGEWRWRVTHPDGTEICSLRRFTVLKDCVADAMRHGYVDAKPKVERRKTE